jgi:hypothetical protein
MAQPPSHTPKGKSRQTNRFCHWPKTSTKDSERKKAKILQKQEGKMGKGVGNSGVILYLCKLKEVSQALLGRSVKGCP